MMKIREIILRTSGAIALALTMVLIPLSQAEAMPTEPCSIEPGTTTGYCGRYPCERIEGDSYVLLKYRYVTLTRPTEAPYCYSSVSSECGANGCQFKSAKPKKRRR